MFLSAVTLLCALCTVASDASISLGTCNHGILNAPLPSIAHHLIKVNYTVIDGVYNSFSDSIEISVPKYSVLITVMEAAKNKNHRKFRFKYEQKYWGQYITSIRNLKADPRKCTYWQLLSGGNPLKQGAGCYVVSDGESLVVKYTTY